MLSLYKRLIAIGSELESDAKPLPLETYVGSSKTDNGNIIQWLDKCMSDVMGCHSINGPGISGPGGPFMFNIIGAPGPLMPKHKWSY